VVGINSCQRTGDQAMHVEVTEKTHHHRNTRIWWDVPD